MSKTTSMNKKQEEIMENLENNGFGIIKLGTSDDCTPHGNVFDANYLELNYNGIKLVAEEATKEEQKEE